MSHQSDYDTELERRQLKFECHGLINIIGQMPYAVKLLRAAKKGLQLYVGMRQSLSPKTGWEE